MRYWNRAAAIAALFSAPALAQDAPQLSQPIDCTLGETCHIQQYVDTDPGPAARDFMCNALSYDGHKGTDFALPSYAAMRSGVRILAAAPGTVRGVRDGMKDRLYTDEMAPAMKGRGCGNGVVITHPGGWETQYCHMREGSVRVRAGDVVDRGTTLGYVGLSGRTQFPHLHISVRRGDAVIDPFNPSSIATCGAPDGETLWIDAPAYIPGALIAAGFTTAVPSFEDIRDGAAHAPVLSRTAPALVAWGYAYGSRPDDILRIVIDGPRGRVFDHDAVLERTQAQFFRAAGRRPGPGGWRAGTFTATITLIRGDTVLDEIQTTTQMQ